MHEVGESRLRAHRILVTDGDQRAALAVVRSLGSADAYVVVAESSASSLAGASRYAAESIQLPSPIFEPAQFIARLREMIDRLRIDILIPITEAALRTVLASDLCDTVLVPFPSLRTFELASDKYSLTQLAIANNIPVPGQMVIESVHEAAQVTGIDFPVVVKPAVSVTTSTHGRRKLSVSHAGDMASLVGAVEELPPEAYPVMLQQRVIGPGVGVFLLRWNGRIVGRFAHRRLREKPPSGGVSVYRESIDPPSDVVFYAEQLLSLLDWQGVAMVEFKVDRVSGISYLMEINGRFWGSLQLAIDAGVDFPTLLANAAIGNVASRTIVGRPGVRLRWLLGDLDHLLLRLKHTNEALHLPRDAKGKLAAAGAFLSLPWRRDDRLEVLRWDDPKPFLREIWEWFRAAIGTK